MHDSVSREAGSAAEPAARPRKANECIIAVKHFKPPEKLFDEFWREGELGLLFGAAGTGKSVLAVQIADAIARGRPIDGFEMTDKRQKVLYVDLKQSDDKFGVRYSGYKVSENLYRMRPESVAGLSNWLRDVIRDNGFRVVVIDDLSAIRLSYDGTRETLPLMRELRQLTDELGVSILVLAASREPGRSGVVSEADMMRSRILCDAADSVFAIGRHHSRVTDRYIIQTRSHSSAIAWHAHNAPVCRMHRTDDGFLGFMFDERFVAKIDEKARDMILNVKWQRDAGATYRLIAEDLGISTSKALRLYRKWTPDMEKGLVFESDESVPPAVAGGLTSDSANIDEQDAPGHDGPVAAADGGGSEPGSAAVAVGGRQNLPEGGEAAKDAKEAKLQDDNHFPLSTAEDVLEAAGCRRSMDKNGREIFVEKEDERGNPRVFYRFDPPGNKLMRWERKGDAWTGQRVDGPICLFNTS